MPRLTTLNSWKEIADYLGRSVRTVQRWEARFGLPVRHRAGKRTSVFAIQAELDSWLQTRSKFRAVSYELPPTTYHMAFHFLPIAISIFNDRREWVDANDASCILLGRTREELRRLRLDDLIIDTDRATLSVVWETMLTQGSTSDNLLLRAPGQHPSWIEFRGFARFVPGFHLVLLAFSRNPSRLIGETHLADAILEDAPK